MTENFYERIQRTLTWQKIIAFNIVLLLVIIVPISVNLAKQDTENRSSAAEVNVVAIPPPNYPAAAPKVERVINFFGKAGDTVVITGANFGDYQWASKVYVGNVDASDSGVVRWSNTIIEAKIPEGARTGKVWVNINGKESQWEGSLLLYDVASSAQVGFQKTSSTQGKIYTTNAVGAVRGMVEIAYVSEPLNIAAAPGILITSQTPGFDSLGKKMKINFEMISPLTSGKAELADYSYPGLGTLEIVRAELYDSSGRLMSIFSNPLAIKVTP